MRRFHTFFHESDALASRDAGIDGADAQHHARVFGGPWDAALARYSPISEARPDGLRVDPDDMRENGAGASRIHAQRTQNTRDEDVGRQDASTSRGGSCMISRHTGVRDDPVKRPQRRSVGAGIAHKAVDFAGM